MNALESNYPTLGALYTLYHSEIDLLLGSDYVPDVDRVWKVIFVEL